MQRRTVTCANPGCGKQLQIWRGHNEQVTVYCSPVCHDEARR